MFALIVMPLVLQVLVPLVLLVWIASGRDTNRAGWFAKVLLVGIYLIAIARAGLWLALPWYLPRLYGLLWLVAVLHTARKMSEFPWYPRRRLAWLRFSALDTGAGFGLLLVAYAYAGTAAPGKRLVDLRLPLEGGVYSVAGGGSNTMLNPHLLTMREPRFGAYHGQSWGVDIIKIGTWGSRRSGLAPKNPGRYAIFGEPVYAPCTGSVVEALDGQPDLNPPHKDRIHLAGNHVLIACNGVWVLLGHLQNGSLSVHTGDQLTEGQQLARVGNSGNTDEPHLHIHAQTPGTRAAPLSGNPIPIRLDGKFLARNDRVQRVKTISTQASQ